MEVCTDFDQGSGYKKRISGAKLPQNSLDSWQTVKG